MKIYVAGPMRGIKDFNFPAFDDAAAMLRTMGHEVCNPAERDREQHGNDVNRSDTGNLDDIVATGFNLRETLSWDLQWIAANADAIAVLPGWENSKGATAEVALALALGLLVAPADSFGSAEWHASDNVYPLYGQVSAIPERDVLVGSNKGEVRTVSATGGEKGVKPERFDLIPVEPLTELARLYGRGAQKYEPRNYERGYEWSKSFGAMQRHAWLWWSGEDMDQETGVPHVINVAWHAFALALFMTTHREFDDRPGSSS